MTTRAIRPRAFSRFDASGGMKRGVVAAALAALAFAIVIAIPSAPAVSALALPVAAGLVVWMVMSREYHLTLAALLLWLGLFDGFVRLKTGTQALTLVRDGLLYAVVVGWLIRASVRGDAIRLPPLTGWVFAFVV